MMHDDVMKSLSRGEGRTWVTNSLMRTMKPVGVGTNAKVRRLVDSHEQHKLHVVDDDRV